jgi:hypothetical protein
METEEGVHSRRNRIPRYSKRLGGKKRSMVIETLSRERHS